MTLQRRGEEEQYRDQSDTLLLHYQSHFVDLIRAYAAADRPVVTVGDIKTAAPLGVVG